MGVGAQRYALAVYPRKETRYPLYRRLGGPQGRSGRVRKISPLPGFDHRTVQPVASRYTDYAIAAPMHVFLLIKSDRKSAKVVTQEGEATLSLPRHDEPSSGAISHLSIDLRRNNRSG
jgi:hypothetical protein